MTEREIWVQIYCAAMVDCNTKQDAANFADYGLQEAMKIRHAILDPIYPGEKGHPDLIVKNDNIEIPNLYYTHEREVFNRDGVWLAKAPCMKLKKNTVKMKYLKCILIRYTLVMVYMGWLRLHPFTLINR